MINILSENGNEKYGICHFTVDTPNELTNLPTNVQIGSICFVISTSEKYMLNSNNQWVKIKINNSITIEPLTITENGTYEAPDGIGYSPVSVSIPIYEGEIEVEDEQEVSP